MTAASTREAADLGEPVLSVDDLSVRFGDGAAQVYALNGVSLRVHPYETLGILGESGSGKSVLLRAVMRLHAASQAQVSGRIVVGGHDIGALADDAMRALRGPVLAMVFQEPGLALDPLYPIGDQIVEAIRAHGRVGASAARARALALLEQVRMPSAAIRIDAYPHELSGGMRQRAMIAVALAANPRLLLADEPTTALDPSVQVQVLLLLRELQRERGMGVVFVTHDVHAAAAVCDRLVVMYGGTIVEEGPTADLLGSPRHPYTAGLLGATVSPDMRGLELRSIAGAPPVLHTPPVDCPFRVRCPRALDACATRPPLLMHEVGRRSACHNPEPPVVGTAARFTFAVGTTAR